MSRYEPLWKAIAGSGKAKLKLDFDDITKILGTPIDHAFLTYKKELIDYGYRVGKISMKEKTVEFLREE